MTIDSHCCGGDHRHEQEADACASVGFRERCLGTTEALPHCERVFLHIELLEGQVLALTTSTLPVASVHRVTANLANDELHGVGFPRDFLCKTI